MIYIGADHRGFPLKERVKAMLEERGIEYTDVGTDNPEEKSDFPDFAFAVGERVVADTAAGKEAYGILSCGSAGGMVIAANKVTGIRAVHATTPELGALAKEHDDANVLIMDSQHTSEELTAPILDAYIQADFDAVERRVRRRDKITEYEQSQ